MKLRWRFLVPSHAFAMVSSEGTGSKCMQGFRSGPPKVPRGNIFLGPRSSASAARLAGFWDQHGRKLSERRHAAIATAAGCNCSTSDFPTVGTVVRKEADSGGMTSHPQYAVDMCFRICFEGLTAHLTCPRTAEWPARRSRGVQQQRTKQ